MKYSIGVDLGGTNIRAAIVDELGNIIKVIKEPTTGRTTISIKNQIVELIDKLDYKDYQIEGIGIGIPGPVKPDGTIIYIPNLGITEEFNLKEMIEKELPFKVYVSNDANVAALAEAKVGNGKGYDVVQYITMSTGIGGGLIINDKIITGKFGLAQEIGSMIIRNGGREISNNKPRGCIESEASGTMLTLKANELGLNCAHAGDLFIKANNGNKIAQEIVDTFIYDVAAFISSIVSYIEPDIFVLGGGLMKSKDYFLDKVIAKVDELSYKTLKGNIKIVVAKYDQDCGIIGAAMQCFN